MSITSTTVLDSSVAGSTPVPKNPYNFGKAIQYSQPPYSSMSGEHKILFNKGRYFETSIYNKDVLQKLCELTRFKPQYNNMIVGTWQQMEDFVIAMNILGFYIDIKIDWI